MIVLKKRLEKVYLTIFCIETARLSGRQGCGFYHLSLRVGSDIIIHYRSIDFIL